MDLGLYLSAPLLEFLKILVVWKWKKIKAIEVQGDAFKGTIWHLSKFCSQVHSVHSMLDNKFICFLKFCFMARMFFFFFLKFWPHLSSEMPWKAKCSVKKARTSPDRALVSGRAYRGSISIQCCWSVSCQQPEPSWTWNPRGFCQFSKWILSIFENLAISLMQQKVCAWSWLLMKDSCKACVCPVRSEKIIIPIN